MRNQLVVKVDDQVALKIEASPYPATGAETFIGENPIGGSTCSEKFSGTILAVVRNDFKTTR